jgi:ADP-ribose pyrophosphatase YjhB (NUDIX family)
MSSAISIFDIKSNFYKNKIIYCGNCGGKNHIFKHCTQPIISLGIILFKYNKPQNEIKYLLVRRKDSIGYVEFIRGKYVLSDIKYIRKIIAEMSQEELVRLQETNFDKLWKLLWMDKDSHYYKKDYMKALEKFEKIKKGYKKGNKIIILSDLIKENKTKWQETEWGLPKGRRNLKEDDLQAADREFREETSIHKNDYSIYNNHKTFEEEYKGSNNVTYKHIYYIAKYIGNKNIQLDPNNYDQKKEISDINFYNLKECENKIRPYYMDKISLLRAVEYYLRHNKLFEINLSSFQNYNCHLSKSI